MRKLIILTISMIAASFCVAQSVSTVEQTGDLNETAVQQVGDNNRVDIDQGVLNSPDVLAALGFSDVGGSTHGNVSNVIQQGGFDGNEAYIFQAGSNSSAQGNSAIVEQYAASGAAGGANEAYALQYGKNNGGTIYQGEDAGRVSGNLGAVGQYGDGNINEIRQYGHNGTAAALTHGDGNQSYLTQSGNGNQGVIVQADVSLSDLTSLIQNRQITTYGGLSNDNIARINQTGDAHMGAILQAGDGNEAFLMQTGSGNVAEINQQGNNNVANITQGN